MKKLPVRIVLVSVLGVGLVASASLALATGDDRPASKAAQQQDQSADVHAARDAAGTADDPPGEAVGGVGEDAGDTGTQSPPPASASPDPEPEPDPTAGSREEPGNPDVLPKAPPAPPVPTMPALAYSSGGGIAGVITTLEINAKGGWTRTRTGQPPRSGVLTRNQVIALNSLLRSPELTAAGRAETGPRPGGPGCADVENQTLTTSGYTFRSGCNDPMQSVPSQVISTVMSYLG